MRLSGITFFAALLIISSLIWFPYGLDFERYRQLFQPLNEDVIILRYSVSIVSRLLTMVIGVGILCRREIFRKLAVVWAILTITFIYWKHPHFVFQKLAGTLEVVHDIDTSFVIYSVMTIVYLTDLTFAGFLLYYFTRKNVKAQFKK